MSLSDGRDSVKHAGKNVYTHRPSIQGKWSEDLWYFKPKHELEVPKVMPIYLTDMSQFQKDKREHEIKNTEMYKKLLNGKQLDPSLVHDSI